MGRLDSLPYTPNLPINTRSSNRPNHIRSRTNSDGTDDNGDNDQSENAIEPKHFIIGIDGLRRNDNRMQLQANINGEANPEINISKISDSTTL
ncbi:MAG: hypothetical protein EZS28_007946, partial [Streblomastix strix]